MHYRPFSLLALMGIMSCTTQPGSPTETGLLSDSSGGFAANSGSTSISGLSGVGEILATAEPGAFGARIPGPGIGARFDSLGVKLSTDRSGIGLRFVGWGRTDVTIPAADVEPVLPSCSMALGDDAGCVAALEYGHNGVRAWWLAVEDGVQHGYVVNEALEGEGDLLFSLSIEGAESVTVGPDADVAWVEDSEGQLWTYGRLEAWDAVGEPLDATLEVVGDELRIRVADEGAVYPIYVDPVVTTAATTVSGAAASEWLGYSTSTAISWAGDVNCDGYDDVIAASYRYSSNQGRVYIYHGTSTGMVTSPSTTLTGATGATYFGYSVSGAGDVNNDNCGDVIISAPYTSNSGLTLNGAAYVYHGSSSGLVTSAAFSTSGELTTDLLGQAVSAAGDINSDGYDDVLVGAPSADQSGVLNVGKTYVFYGSSSGVTTTGRSVVIGSIAQDNLGYSVSGAGDVNGDGYGDIIVGATGVDNGAASAVGAAYVYKGSASGLVTSPAIRSYLGGAAADASGTAVSGAGDLNNDGYDDFIVGAPAVDISTTVTNVGRFYVYHGGTTLPTTAAATVTGSAKDDNLGRSLSDAGDTNGDGYADIIVGMWGYDSGGTLNTGRALVYHGSATGMVTTAATTLTGGAANDYFGHAVSGANDVNGDGADDVIVSAYNADGTAGSDVGKVYLYVGCVDADGDGYCAGTTDCNDSRADVNPAATEQCDAANVDEDCDGLTDDADSSVSATYKSIFYIDADMDGFGVSTGSTTACDAPTGYADNAADCNDASAAVGGEESWYRDADGDGYGNTDVSVGACSQPSGYVANDLDCNDSSASVRGPNTYYADEDGDGYGDVGNTIQACSLPTDYVTNDDDCDDTRSEVNPAGLESCSSANVDEDCDGLIDGADSSADTDSYATFYRDADGDGYGTTSPTTVACDAPAGYADNSGDCDDTNAAVVGNQTWYQDADGDGYGNSAVTTTACAQPSGYVSNSSDCNDSSASVGALLTWYRDIDGDGYGTTATTTTSCSQPSGYVSASTDCNDGNASISPGASEVCDSSNVDEDCDGTTDDNDATVTGKSTWYRDADSDSYGTSSMTSSACDQPSGYVSTSTDCNDSSSSINPAATEVCDSSNVDEDCDGSADDSDASATGKSTWYRDVDGDTYGGTSTTTSACDVPSGYSAVNTDCNDGLATVHPGASEVCDAANLDENCNGVADNADSGATGKSTFYQDADADTYGNASVSTSVCDRPTGYVGNATDCNDSSAVINPAATEVCDASDTDEDCDGVADNSDPGASGKSTYYRDADSDTYGNSAVTTSSCEAVSGYVSNSTDCNDSSSSINPGASEVCDGGTVDEDCDGLANSADPSATGTITYYRDADSDAYGSASVTTTSCSVPSGYVANSTDCNDSSASINPGATEVCDSSNVDEDCDGAADDSDTSASGKSTYYRDADTDTYGSSSVTTTVCDQPSGYVTNSTDCNDSSSSINPAATEVCDSSNVDEDCDGAADDSDTSATGKSTWYRDLDADTYGGTSTTSACDLPSGYVATSTDCNDSSASINPGATEVCDSSNVDEDCDGAADNADASATGKTTYYQDSDADTYGNASVSSTVCDPAAGYVTNNTDCNDTRSAINPGATEVCDSLNVDEDCDGAADNADTSATGKSTYYRDADSDTYGNPSMSSTVCDAAAGYVSNSTDCNDSSAAINPAATEVCDSSNVDEDCDGAADNADASATGKSTYYQDADSDTYGNASMSSTVCDPAAGYVTNATDCNDTRSAINPGATEVCDSLNVDEDCDGTADDADASATGKSTWYRDADSDNYGNASMSSMVCDQPSGYVTDATDCNDSSGSIYPGATEIGGDGIDQDCDGSDLTNDADGDGVLVGVDCDDTDPMVGAPMAFYRDTDGDTYGGTTTTTACTAPSGYVAMNGDCNDSSAAINPGADEVCDSSNVDEDCNGLADNADAGVVGADDFYGDSDGDGYGDASVMMASCDQPSGYVTNATDCNDSSAAINPGATEVCDSSNVDEDCDGAADNADTSATGKVTYYGDADSDGYGNASVSATVCDPAAGYVTNATDCNDTRSAINPGATEVCDSLNVDEDCDGAADNADTSATGKSTYYQDSDGDTYGNASMSSTVCDAAAGYVSNSTDCNDSSAAINPAATEVCDSSNVDEDCDGAADNADASATGKSTYYRDSDGDTYGNASVSSTVCDAAAGYVSNSTDCNDSSSSINPGAAEVCDSSNVDEDCDGAADNADASATGKSTYYRDSDGDTYGNASMSSTVCDAAAGYVTNATDCNDTSAAINPAATEVCDSSNVDEDCDGAADDMDASATGKSTWYRDADSDTYGNPSMSSMSCEMPSGYVAIAGDCDDTNASVTGSSMVYADTDGDGYGDASTGMLGCVGAGWVTNDDDCDDSSAAVTLGGIWYADADADGLGNGMSSVSACTAPSGYVANTTDCDDGNAAVGGPSLWYADADSDTLGDMMVTQTACAAPSGYVADSSDCDDSSALVGAADIWYADADSDGFGNVMLSDTDCTAPSGYVADSTDCNDSDASVNPGASEVCGNGDNDCDGQIDEGISGSVNWYTDGDGDGIGTGTAITGSGCTLPSGYALSDGDCDDADPYTWPGAGYNEDDTTACMTDMDEDGFGEPFPADGVTPGSDCDDLDELVYPGSPDPSSDCSDPYAASILINNDAVYTNTAAVTLTLSAQDDVAVTEMCISNLSVCTTWVPYATTYAYGLGTTTGVRTVYATFRDGDGNTSSQVSDQIILDRTAPVNGTVSATAGDGEVTLTWSGYVDSYGIASYTVVQGDTTAPATCTTGTTVYTGTATTVTVSGLTNGNTYGFRVCATDPAGNTSTGKTTTSRPASEFDAPTGSVVINGDALWARTSSATLTISATDASGVAEMCVSNTASCTNWEAYSTSKTWTMSGVGTSRMVFVRFRDIYNNTSASYSDTIGYDASSPTNGTVTGVGGNGIATLSWSGFTDSISGVASYVVVRSNSATAPSNCLSGISVYTGTDTTTVVSGLTNGTNYGFRVCAYDTAGNLSTGASTTVKPVNDAEGPVGSILINSGDAWTKTTAVTLTLDATDPAGVTEMCISNSSTCTSWVTYATSYSWTLSGSGSPRTVYASFKDTNGNISAATYSDEIGYDATAPTNGTVSTASADGAITLSWSGYSDATSGIASYTVVRSTTSSAPASCSTGTVVYTGTGTTATATGLTNGTTYGFRVCATDVAGNTSTGATVSAAPYIELNAPTGTVSINSDAAWTTANAVTLTLAATDDTAVTEMCVSNSTSCTSWVSYATSYSWTLSGSTSTRTVYVKFRDASNNVSATATDTIGYDATKPVNGTVTGTGGASSVTLSWSGFSDTTSGVASYTVVRSTTSTAPSSCSTGTTVYTGTDLTTTVTGLTTNTTYGFRVCATDTAGNVSTGATASVKAL